MVKFSSELVTLIKYQLAENEKLPFKFLQILKINTHHSLIYYSFYELTKFSPASESQQGENFDFE